MAKNKICGIYLIRSKIKPNRIYVGSSFNIKARFYLHKSQLRCNKHHTPKLQCHVNKYGIDDLMFYVMEVYSGVSTKYLVEREQFYMDLLNPWFNSRLIAESCRGMKHSEDAKKKLSEAKRGVPLSESHKKSLKRAWEHRKINHPMSEEHMNKFKMSSTGRKPWNTGLTKETDERLAQKADKLRGRAHTDKERQKISDALKGRPHSDEHNKKVGDALRGRKQAPDVVEAKRKRVKEWWDKKRRESFAVSES